MKLKQKISHSFGLASIFLASTAFYASSQCPSPPITGSIDTLITCAGDMNGALSVQANGLSVPVMISEVDMGSPDFIEIQNVSGASLDLTGYYVATSNSYTLINTANTLTWALSGTVPAGWVDYRGDGTGANYWGNNLFYNSGSNGWVVICDASNTVVDAVFWGWDAASIATFAPVVGGNTLVLPAAEWVGNGVNATCVNTFQRLTATDVNDLSDWTCVTASQGVANVTGASGGGVFASVLWSTGDTTASIWGLGAGTYSVSTVDTAGCAGSETFVLIDPLPVSAADSVTNISCFGLTDGSAGVAASGGTGALTVSWGGANPSMLPAGYSVYTVTDSVGCSITDSVIITEPSALTSGLVLSGSIACFGDSVSAQMGASGGTPGYTYNWSTGDTIAGIVYLSAGMSTHTLIDANGCTVVDSISLVEPAALSISGTTSDEISGADGSIDITVAGGTTPYAYSWDNGAGTVEDPTGLVANTYNVTVTDSNGCMITGTYTVDSQVGLDELTTGSFNIVPNPNDGVFELTVQDVNEGGITIYNAVGKKVYQKELTNDNQLSIDISSLKRGVYLIRLTSGNNSMVRRMVKK